MRVVLRTLLMLALILGIAQVAWGDTYDDGAAAYKRGNYSTALRLWRPLADQGHAKAQAYLGLMYGHGRGVTLDNLEAVRWFRLAANQGNANAQDSLGLMHANGQGVAQDSTEAMKWFRLAANQGHLGAQSNFSVGYYNGQGVPQDYVEAHKWMNLAGIGGDKDATKKLRIIETKMTREQIAEARRRASEWKLAGYAAPPVRANWAKVAWYVDGSTSYVDIATIHKDGNLRRVWLLKDLKARDPNGAQSTVIYLEVACNEKLARALQSSSHSGPMATGNILATKSDPDEWSKPPSNTATAAAAEKLIKLICSN